MHLPYGARAHVSRRKVIGYLLSSTHPFGRHKARFFTAIGFSPDRPAELIDVLLSIARTGSVVDRTMSFHDERYIVDGEAYGVPLRTVWAIGHGSVVPRFITAFPRPRRKMGVE